MAPAAQACVVGATLVLGATWLFAFWLDAHALFLAPLLVYAFLVWAATRSPQLSASDAVAIATGLSVCHALLQWTGLRVEVASFLDSVVRSPEVTSY